MMAARESGRFVKGYSYSPSTQIRRGEHLSAKTEFKPGQHAHNKLAIGAVTVRRESRTGLYRAWIKVGEPNVWKKRAVVVWESIYGRLPHGWVVHHRDRNSLNDDINNLRAMTRKEHADEHRAELNIARMQKGR